VVTWRGSFVILGLISHVWVAAWVWYFRDSPAEHQRVTNEELERLPNRGRVSDKTRVAVPWKRLAHRMWPVTIVYFCYGWTLWMYLNWLPSYLLHEYNLQLSRSALFAAAIFSAGVGGDYLGGVITDTILKRTGNVRKARCHFVVLGFSASFLCVLPIFLTHDLTVVVLLCRAGDWADVGDSDGYRAQVLRYGQRLHEYRFGDRGRPFAADVRISDRSHWKLEPAVHRVDGPPARRRHTLLLDASGRDLPGRGWRSSVADRRRAVIRLRQSAISN
jgi:hypothetical protein